MTSIPAIISVHDVMPDTLDRVKAILNGLLRNVENACVTLLVVPGLDWQPEQIQLLKAWQAQGYELAGHGWRHEARDIKSLYHRLHSLFLSRRAAEHLSLTQSEVIQLMQRNLDWFAQQTLVTPLFYVPPAWALGAISQQEAASLPYRYIETTSGIVDVVDGTRYYLPLTGFEADTPWRAGFLWFWNQLNYRSAMPLKPVRMSIHPYDLEYRMAGQLQWLVKHCSPVQWRVLFQADVAGSINEENHG